MLLAKCGHVIIAYIDSDLGNKHDFGGGWKESVYDAIFGFELFEYN